MHRFVFTERERVLQALASHDVLRTALLLPGGLGRGCCCRAADSRLQIAFRPLLEDEERQYSEKKEALYREACRNDPASLHLVAGAEELLQGLQKRGIPFALASASIKANVDFYFDSFPIGHWLKQQDVVYDDGSYADKGEMHLEAARRLGVPFSECLVIEDSVTAIALAKRNGAGRIVGVGETADGSELLALGADHYIHDFPEFD